MQSAFFIAMGAGLLGGLGHCSGMCGPIVATFSVSSKHDDKHMLAQGLYNLGRISTYTALGAMVGGLGTFIGVASRMEGAQYVLLALTGFFMLLVGLSIAGALKGFFSSMVERHNAPVIRAARGIASLDSPFKFLPLGLVLGLLPCGLSYSMLIAASGAGGAAEGGMIMLSFGLGTVPAMFLIGTLSNKLGHVIRGRLYRVGGMLVALMGAVYLYRAWVYYGSM